MIKIEDIQVNSLYFTNIFLTKSKEIEVIDIIFNIDYYINEDEVNISKYNITKRDLATKTIEDLFACYMIVPLEFDTYKKIDEISYSELEYLILSDITSDLDEYNQFIPDSEKEIAFNIIKEHLKTEQFKNELSNTFKNGKQII